MIGTTDREAAMAALVRAMPYIRLYRGRTFVIKIGGELVADAAAVDTFTRQLSVLVELGIRAVVVHGGGPQTTRLAERLGIASPFVRGRRVTCPETLKAAVMAISGTVNTMLLASARRTGVAAVGLSGIDAGLVRARRRPPVALGGADGPETVDYGEVGDIEAIDGAVIDRLIAGGFVPIVSPLSADDHGRVLNVNADTVAARLAVALGAGKLIFLTTAHGILEDPADPGSLVSYTDLAGLGALEQEGILTGGMLPKAHAARCAIEGGVNRVHIVGFSQSQSLLIEVFTNEGSGTMIVRDRAELLAAEKAPSTVTP